MEDEGMTEPEKMRNGELADMSDPELQRRFERAKKLLARMRGLSTYDEAYRGLLEELVPGIPATSVIFPPFYCIMEMESSWANMCSSMLIVLF
ncbi:putative maltose O-acetyltransferase [Bacteroides pyogenes JCM 10003]|nr:putative maltose O-acetyltransferase [Bacteroides pyogenes JCM 10003]